MSLRSLLLVALLPLTACRTATPVHFSSSPPGVEVHIDGTDSGFVTPCLIDLEDGPTRQVEFVLPGYVTELRSVAYAERKDLVYWREAAIMNTWNFPLWLGAKDFFVPRKKILGESPARLYVRMRRQADG